MNGQVKSFPFYSNVTLLILNLVPLYSIAGSGLAITEQGMQLPGCQGQVRISDLMDDDVCPWKYNSFKDEYTPDCSSCIETHPCEECQYFPIYPCYSPKVCSLHSTN